MAGALTLPILSQIDYDPFNLGIFEKTVEAEVKNNADALGAAGLKLGRYVMYLTAAVVGGIGALLAILGWYMQYRFAGQTVTGWIVLFIGLALLAYAVTSVVIVQYEPWIPAIYGVGLGVAALNSIE